MVFKTIIKIETGDKKPTIKTDDKIQKIIENLKTNKEYKKLADDIIFAAWYNKNRTYRLA